MAPRHHLSSLSRVVFVFTFGFNKGGPEKTIARVGSYRISAAEYYQAYNRMENFYRNLYKDKFDEDMKNQLKLKEAVMGQLVDRYLFLTTAEEMGVRVSDKEFTEYLSGIEVFKRNGVFDQQVYEEFLKRNNLDPKTFEEERKRGDGDREGDEDHPDNGVRTDEKAAYEPI